MGESFNIKLLGADNEYVKSLSYVPDFFNIRQETDQELLTSLIKSNTNIQIIDEIDSQLEELIKLRNPKKKFKPEELSEAILNFLDGCPKTEYGQWVYYPWLNKLIHLLDRDEYIEVRTNRNQYKITPEEEITLTSKKIGIIGLSVGKAIALTIATERICGELVLADFDVIELSNLNRIQTGVQNFGLKKTVVVAREIAEIDPYLKVSCFHDGLTESNADQFFTKNGKLDICIEVCDGLYTKIFARQKARSLGIPVVMNSSDRGTTDVERYDLDPKLPILHGLIDHLDLDKVKEAKTNEEKVPYLLPMLGLETSSERLKASMLEIEETITTWPQLASGVIFGGGICTDVCRRILLGQFTKSGRYFVDVEDVINDEAVDYISQSETTDYLSKIHFGNSSEDQKILPVSINKLFSQNREAIELNKEQLKELVYSGIAAPTAGNIQPWKWVYKNNDLYLIHDPERGKSILNYRDTASLIGLGAATENVILKAQQMGLEVLLTKFPNEMDREIYARFSFLSETSDHTENHDPFELVTEIPKRITNRTLDIRKPLNKDIAPFLQDIIQEVPGARLNLISEPKKIDTLKEIIAEIDWIIMTNQSCHAQFMHEIRWNRKEVEATRDGLDLDTFDITPTERAGLLVARNWNVTKHIKKWGLGKEFGKMSRKAIDACSALGLITMPNSYPDAYFDGGRVIEKVWLGATKKGLSFQPMSISTFLSERIADNNFSQIEDVKDKIIGLHKQLKEAFEIEDGYTDVFLFRLSYADEPRIKPLRRKLEDVLINE